MADTQIMLRRGLFLSIFAGTVAGPFACSGPADLRSLNDPQAVKVHHVDAGKKDAGKKKEAGAANTDAETGETACVDYATILCTKFDSCTQSVYVAEHYDSMDECVQRESLTCIASLSAPDNPATPLGVEHCGAALGAGSCNDLFDHTNTPSSCAARPSVRANGAPCAFGGQCQSTWCYAAPTSLCGICATRPDAGGACTTNADCGENGLHCSAAGVCEPVVPVGSACGPTALCPFETQCVGPNAGPDAGDAATGICVAEGSEAGAPCDPTLKTAPLCAEGQGYFCPSATSQCALASIVEVGAKCGTTAGTRIPDASNDAHTPSQLARCRASDLCIAAVAGSKAQFCVGAVPEYSACDDTNGPPCLPPARCVLASDASTVGVCSILGVTAQCNY